MGITTATCGISSGFSITNLKLIFKMRNKVNQEVHTSFTVLPFISQSVWDVIKPGTSKFFLKRFTGLLIRPLSMGTRKKYNFR